MFRDRPPDEQEFDRLRLTLSSYRDGSGQLTVNNQSYPGWRDFERATAAAFDGRAVENKGVFDVEIDAGGSLPYGLSLKTSALRAGNQVLMELSNAHAKFWARLEHEGIDPSADPGRAGGAIIGLIEEWHLEVRDRLDIRRSSYLVLAHSRRFDAFRLFWYSLDLRVIDPAQLRWEMGAKRIAGFMGETCIWEWYGWSGGQLKWYPLIDWSRWASPPFSLEEPPPSTPADKAAAYWPERWERTLR